MDMYSYGYKYVLTYTAKGLICALYFTHKKQFLTWYETVVRRTSCGTRNRGTREYPPLTHNAQWDCGSENGSDFILKG